MKAVLGVLFSLLVTTQAMASEPSLTCSLTSGKDKHIVTLNLNDGYTYQDEYKTVGEEFDLGLVLDNTCEGAACSASLVIISQIVEDEVGSTGFDFEKSARGVVYQETLTNAPDKHDYELVCTIAE